MTAFISVLVDGDNISGKHAGAILDLARKHGQPSVTRVYLDASRPSDWQSAPAFRMMHAGTGKNASDILLALDAMELLLSGGINRFVIASSDGDFTHLAMRLREKGAKVIGTGEAKAPDSFRASCSEFVEIAGPKASPKKPKAPPKQADVAQITKPLDLKIRDMIAQHSTGGTGMRIAELAPKMHAKHGVKISTYSERSWRAYLNARPTLYKLDPRGPEAKVRFCPKGFAQSG